MQGIDNFDPALFGAWPEKPAYDGWLEAGEIGWSEAECRRQAADILLETKSADVPPEDLRLLLNDMTREMREQFDHFRKLRATAELLCGPDADDAAAKLARADIKAATDAMSLIVRTLEKVDALQRQLARDREMEAERNADSLGYEEKKRLLMELIEKRVQERVDAIVKQREHIASARAGDGAEGQSGPDDAIADTGPPAIRTPAAQTPFDR
ncbi:hypothetical protein [Rhizobium sp. BK376]|uniref:hypothetical protein n=1 Tax=Rhizobium sp. BK376 TaxID=2512149 RepID=UPI0010EF756D|nr:hypothetical protein [Rhizobium sp. BK376]TCR93182.1 hypothetical protein EV561_101628 [Rhizobium sp. BK376]